MEIVQSDTESMLIISQNEEAMSYLANVPLEYQEVEYIQSSGNAYIDTGFIPEANYFKLYLDFKAVILYGASNISNSSQYNFAGYMTTSAYETYFGTSGYSHINYGISNGVRYKYTCEANNGTAKLINENGTVLQTATYPGNLRATGNYNFGIFRRQEKPQYTSYGNGTLYACRMYTTGGVLVRDFYCCYRKSDNVVGLYDKVNKVFYTNAGSGSFTKGPDYKRTD